MAEHLISFQSLATSIMYKQPENPRQFLLNELRQLQTKKWTSSNEDFTNLAASKDLPGLIRTPSAGLLSIPPSTSLFITEHMAPQFNTERGPVLSPAPPQAADPNIEQVNLFS